MQYDVFISHASYDKDQVARPLSEALQKRGLKVWLDEEQLQIGDSIRRGIDAALRESAFGIAILSPTYLSSEWGQKELDAFFVKEKYQSKSILPLYHGVEIEDVEQHWPMLADKVSLSTSQNIDFLADRIQQSIQHKPDKVFIRSTQNKKGFWWPLNSWQWLITVIVGLAVIAIPFLFTSTSTNNYLTVNGDTTGNITQINIGKVEGGNINPEQLAKQLVKNFGHAIDGNIQSQENEIKKLTNTISRLQQNPADEYKQEALRMLAENKPDEASIFLEKSIAERSKIRQHIIIQEAIDWVDIGNIAYLSNTKKAKTAYQKATALDPLNIIAWSQLGLIYDRLGDIERAINAQKAVQNLIGTDSPSQELASSYTNLASIYYRLGETEKAVELFLQALDISSLLKDENGIANNYGNLGVILVEHDDFPMANEFFSKSLEIYRTLGNQSGIARLLGNIGRLAIQEEDFDRAEKLLLEALELDESLGRLESMSYHYTNLGLMYSTKGNPDKTEYFLKKSIEINQKLGHLEGIALDYWNLGALNNQRGKIKIACKYWLKAYDIYNELGNEPKKKFGKDFIDKNCKS